jgi:hypothetical protein
MNDDDVLALLRRYRRSYTASGNGGRQVHASWRDMMTAQGRAVAPERMDWDTLDDRDKRLDHEIAALLIDDYLGWVFDRMAHDHEP